MDAKSGDISVSEAKLRLLEWSEQADEAMHHEVHELIATAKKSAVKAVPWAGGGGLLMGLLMGWGKRRGPAADARPRGAISSLIGTLSTAIKVATFALPLIRPFFANRHRDE